MAEEIAYLKSELGLSDKTTRSAVVQLAFSITAQEARALIALADAKGRVLTHNQLEDAMERSSGGELVKITGVYVSRLRKALGSFDAIETVWGQGYRITPIGLAKVNTIGAGATSPDAR